MDRSSIQKINKSTEVLNNTIDQLDLIDIYRILHPNNNNTKHSFQAYNGIFSRVDYILGYKESLNKFKRI